MRSVLIGAVMIVVLAAGLEGCESPDDTRPQQAMDDASISAAVQA